MKFISIGTIALVVFLFIKFQVRKKKSNKKYGELIAAAVSGWVSALTDKGINNIDITDSFHGSYLLLCAKILNRTCYEYPELDDDQIRKFVRLLTKHLQAEALKGGSTTLQTDWSAQPPLLNICRKSGMGPNEFPSKAVMRVDFDNQKVTYRFVPDDWQQIYPEDENLEEVEMV